MGFLDNFALPAYGKFVSINGTIARVAIAPAQQAQLQAVSLLEQVNVNSDTVFAALKAADAEGKMRIQSID